MAEHHRRCIHIDKVTEKDKVGPRTKLATGANVLSTAQGDFVTNTVISQCTFKDPVHVSNCIRQFKKLSLNTALEVPHRVRKVRLRRPYQA